MPTVIPRKNTRRLCFIVVVVGGGGGGGVESSPVDGGRGVGGICKKVLLRPQKGPKMV